MRGERRVRAQGGASGLTLRLGPGGQERRRIGLEQDNLSIGTARLEHAPHALKGPAGAIPGDKVVEALPLKRLDNLGPGGLRVVVRIGLVLEGFRV